MERRQSGTKPEEAWRFIRGCRAFFYDTGRIEAHDGREDYGEDRWVTIGLAYSAVLYVVYTVRHEETIRLIFARKANVNERKKYREANS